MLRFENQVAQLKARDVVQTQAAHANTSSRLSQVPRTPGWMRALGLKPMSLGLDLRGGVYFLYEVDVKGAVTQLLSGMERDYRLLLRNERIPFTGISSNNTDAVKITVRSGEDVNRAAAALRKQDPNVSLTTDSLGEGGVSHRDAATRRRSSSARISRSSRTSRRCAIASTN